MSTKFVFLKFLFGEVWGGGGGGCRQVASLLTHGHAVDDYNGAKICI
jgi:hypothetical protein